MCYIVYRSFKFKPQWPLQRKSQVRQAELVRSFSFRGVPCTCMYIWGRCLCEQGLTLQCLKNNTDLCFACSVFRAAVLKARTAVLKAAKKFFKATKMLAFFSFSFHEQVTCFDNCRRLLRPLPAGRPYGQPRESWVTLGQKLLQKAVVWFPSADVQCHTVKEMWNKLLDSTIFNCQYASVRFRSRGECDMLVESMSFR